MIKKKLAAHGIIDSSIKRRRTQSTEGSESYDISKLFLPDNAPLGEVSSELATEDIKPNASVSIVDSVFSCIIIGHTISMIKLRMIARHLRAHNLNPKCLPNTFLFTEFASVQVCG